MSRLERLRRAAGEGAGRLRGRVQERLGERRRGAIELDADTEDAADSELADPDPEEPLTAAPSSTADTDTEYHNLDDAPAHDGDSDSTMEYPLAPSSVPPPGATGNGNGNDTGDGEGRANGGEGRANEDGETDWPLLTALGLVALVVVLVVPAGAIALSTFNDTSGRGPVAEGWAGSERLNVTTTADGRVGSLRDVISRANASGTDTVVELRKDATYRLTARCGAVEPEDGLATARTDGDASEANLTDNDSGDLDLGAGGGGIRVEGNGATIVQECPNERVVHAQGSDRVSLAGVTLAGGRATSPQGHGSGGALLSEGGADVTITNSLLTSNSAQDSGGAVAVSGRPGSLALKQTVVSGNSAGSAGGGVWVLGDLNAINSTLTDNLAASNGGAVATNAGLEFATVVDNSATDSTEGRQLGAVNLTSFGSYVAGGAGATDACSVNRAKSDGYNVGDDSSCGFGNGVGDLADGPRDAVGLLGRYGKELPARPPVPGSVLVDRIPPPTCQKITKEDGQGRERRENQSCDVGSMELPVGLEVPLTATASNVAEPVSARATYTG